MRKVPKALLDLAAAVAVPVIADRLDPELFTFAEELLLAMLAFVAIAVLEILLMATSAFHVSRADRTIWESRTELDGQIQELRRLFHLLEEDRRNEVDLFASYFEKRLADFITSLREAVSKKEVRIDETMFAVTTWLLESSFRGRPEDIFRAVYLSADESFFFDVHARRYFDQVMRLVRDGRCSGVRRLIVLNRAKDGMSERMQRLIAFHNRTDKFDCRVIGVKEFRRIVRDFKQHHLVKDFGIYGDTYLYKGLTNESNEIVGIYSREPAELAAFVKCFEALWASAQPVLSDNKVKARQLTVDWLFGFDAEDPPPSRARGQQEVPTQ